MPYRLYLGPIDGDPKNFKALEHSIKTYYGEGALPRHKEDPSKALYNNLSAGEVGIYPTCPPEPPCVGCESWFCL